MRGLIASGLLAVAGVLAVPAGASADARITVRLTDHEGRPVDGSVTLTSSAATRSCRTTASRCTLTVPAGTYTVVLRPARGSAPPARTLRVPASGTVALALTAGPPRVQSTSVQQTSTAVQRARPARRSTTTTATGGADVTRRATAVEGTRRPRTTTARRTTSSTNVRRAMTNTAARRATRTSPSPSTGTGSSGATEGGSSTSTEEPDGDSPSVGSLVGTSLLGGGSVRDLSSGDRLAVQGRVLDGAGRPVDATITVKRGDDVVGRVTTTSSRFSMYDLDAGTYDVVVRPSRGDATSRRVTVGSETLRITLRVR